MSFWKLKKSPWIARKSLRKNIINMNIWIIMHYRAWNQYLTACSFSLIIFYHKNFAVLQCIQQVIWTVPKRMVGKQRSLLTMVMVAIIARMQGEHDNIRRLFKRLPGCFERRKNGDKEGIILTNWQAGVSGGAKGYPQVKIWLVKPE